MKKLLQLISFLCLLFITKNANAATVDWTGTTSTDWNTASNWNTNTVPTSNDYVNIQAGTNMPTLSTTATVINVQIFNNKSLTIASNGRLNIIGDGGNVIGLTLDGGTLINNGEVIIEALNGSTLTYTELDLRGNGNVSVFTNNGYIRVNSTSVTIASNANSGLNTITNNGCGVIVTQGGGGFNNNSILNNNGLIICKNNFSQNGTFANNGVIKYNSLSGSFTNTLNPAVIVNNSLPIFTFGGTYNGTINGIYSDTATTLLAGIFTAPNTFVPACTLPNGTQTLYAKIIPNGGGCAYNVPFTYVNNTVTQPTVYVNKNATGLNNGTTWANAFVTVQDGINACGATQVWVAAGTYYPTLDVNSTITANARTKTFLMKSGVSVYGGFAGTETLLTQVNPATNVTILSGDFNNDDVVSNANNAATLSISGNTENAYHVVTSNNPNAAITLNGCTISGGNTDAGNNPYLGIGGGNSDGAGVFSLDGGANFTISQCLIKNNTATSFGGGICFRGGSPTITNCKVFNNIANLIGGGIFNTANTTMTNIAVFRNKSSYGGGLELEYNHNINGIAVYNNYASFYGGGIYVFNKSTNAIRNAVVYGNTSGNFGAGIYNYVSSSNQAWQNASIINNRVYNGAASSSSATPLFTNCIIWGAGVTNESTNTPTYTNCNVQGVAASGTNISTNPIFKDINNPAGADGIWFTADDGLQLGCNSPCYNTGTNTGAPLLDILGNGIFATTKDMGAYESQVDVTIVSTLTAGTTTNPTTCLGSNGNIAFTSTNIPDGSYTFNYTKNATSASSTITVASNAFSLTGLSTGVYANFQVVYSCAPVSGASITLSDPVAPIAPTASPQTICVSGTVANLTTTSGINIKWYANATGGTALASTTTLVTGTSYFASQTVNSCESVSRTEVLVNINALPTITLGAGSIICAGTTSFQIAYTATTGSPTTYSISGPGMVAVVNAPLPASPITINLSGPSVASNYTYTMTVKNATGCQSVVISPTLAVNALPAAPTAVDQSFCIVNNPTVASLVPAISTTAIWFNTATGGTALVGTTALTYGDYYVANFSGTCESNRTKVIVSITPVLVPSVGAYAICQNAVVPVGEGLVASNSTYTNTINDNIVAGPTFVRGSGSTRTTYTPSRPVFYIAYTIVSPISGDVTFETIFANLIPFNEDDTYLTLFQTSFNPANPATNFLRGDDDSGTGFLSSLTQTLVMGETYVIVVSSFGSNETGPFTLQASQNVFSNTPTVNWYTTASGGSPIFTGFLFNPVGVAGSGIADTATAATTTFYVSSSSNFDCRTAVTFTVNPSPVAGTAIGTQMVCANKQLANLSVSGFTDNVIKWQKATDAVFTTPIDIPNSNNAILTGAIAGTVSATTYFRAVISNGTCTAFSNVVAVTVTSTIYDNAGIWTNGIPNGNMAIVFDKDFNISSDLLGCSCQVNYGINVTISNNANLVLENNLDVQGTGTMTFDNNTSLLQKNSTIANTGNILYNRTTTPYEKFDYEYWSTPVSNPAMTMPVLNVPFANWRLTSAYKYSPENYNDDAPVDGYDDNGDQWTSITPTTVLVPAKGYAIMAPTASVVFAPTVTANVIFDGIPNNGNIGIPLILSPMNYPGGNYNLIGNPYPSAIDADNFINTNLANISGTLYFWTHVGDLSAANPGIFPANYNSDDYAIYNLLGGVGTRAALTAGATSIPTGKIASGQGFFVKANANNPAVFNNTMRVLGNNDQFFRSANPTVLATNSSNDQPIKDRLWLNLENNLGTFSQQLLGYLPNSTLDFDKGYDGLYSKTSNYINFYSYLNNQDSDLYKIQSRGNFQDSDLVKLGYFSSFAGDFKISIDQVEGILNEESTNIYIQDNLTNTVHNLKNSDYNFTTAIGDFNDRFLLRYTNINLTNTNFELSNNDVIVYKNNQNINIVSTNTELKEVQIYDIRGRLIAENKSPRASEGGTRKVSFDNLNIAQQILIVKIKTIDNKIVSKKIVF